MLDPYLQALRKIESSGNYGAVGPKTRKGNRAYGAYQVMDFNIPGWTQKHYGQQLTPEQFLRNTEAQDAVARGQFGGYVNKYGPDDAASMWFSGRPLKGNTSADVTGTNVPEYVRRFRAAYGGSDPANNRVDQAFQDVGEPSSMLSATTAQPEARPVNGMGRGSGMGGQGGFRNFLTNNRGLLLGLGADLLARGMDTRQGFSGRGMLAGSISDDRRSGRQAEAERAQQQANVTANYLESQGADPAVVDMARQGMGAQAMSEFTRMNKQSGPDYSNYKVVDGRLIDLSGGTPADVTPAGAASAGAFEGTGASVQAVNDMIARGEITREQGAQWLSGKVVTGPEGQLIHITPGQVFGADQPETRSAGGSTGTQITPAKETPKMREARGFYDRMINSQDILAKTGFEEALTDAWSAGAQGVIGGRYVQSDSYKNARQAAENWIRANLRKESGAAIGEKEMEDEYAVYFPLPGEGPEQIAQKRQAREIATQNMLREAEGSEAAKRIESQNRKTKIIQDAEDAIAKGADPDAVWQRAIETFKGM